MQVLFNQDKLKAIIVEKLASLAYLSPDCEFYRFEDERGDSYRQGVMKITDEEEDISVVFSVPHSSANIFILVTDGPGDLVRKVIANLDEIDRDEKIGFGAVKLLSSTELSALGIAGFIVLPVETSNLLGELSSSFKIEDHVFKFCLVVPISSEEYSLWKDKGHDALVNYFSDTEKDLIDFRA